eukprot:6206847-Pleurochrysis_carterae.AAC.1
MRVDGSAKVDRHPAASVALKGEVPHNSARAPRIESLIARWRWAGANALGVFPTLSDVHQVCQSGTEP